jgi:transcription termination factor Rho
VPKDQETAATHRRVRRQDTPVAAEPTFTEAVVQPAGETKVTRASSPSPEHPRRKVRATTEESGPETTPTTSITPPAVRASTRAAKAAAASRSTEGAIMANMDTPQSVETIGDMPPQRTSSERPTGRGSAGATSNRGRKTGAASLPDASVQAPSAAVIPSETTKTPAFHEDPSEVPARVRRGPRVSRPRASHNATEFAQAQAVPQLERTPGQDEPGPGNPESSKAGPAVKSARTARTTSSKTSGAAGRGHVRAGASSDGAVRGQASEAALPKINEGENHTMERGRSDAFDHGAATSPSFAAEPYRPAARSAYRFGRSRPESAAGEAVEPDVSAGRHVESGTSRQQPPSPAAAADHGHRPLRRAGWSGQNGQEPEVAPREARTSRERVQPHVPGGTDPYRDRGRQTGQRSSGANPSRVSGGASGGHSGQRGQFSNPPAGQPGGRSTTPYSPGGRGGHASSSSSQPPISGQDAPYPPSGGQNNNSPIPGWPYGGYDPYDPYALDARDSRASHDRTGQSGRPLRGRGYSNQQSGGYEQRDPRAPRQSSVRPPSPADYYRREQGLTNQRDLRGSPPGRSTLGSHGTHDRRSGGAGTSRGPVNGGGRVPREPREPGYPNSLYTSVPGSPSLAHQAPHEHNDRYDRASSAGPNNQSGLDTVPGMRSSGPVVTAHTLELTGILWQSGGSFGGAELLDGRTLLPLARVNAEEIRRIGLRQGDMLTARVEERSGRRYVVAIDSVNDERPETAFERPMFDKLTPSFPERRIHLENGPQPISVRIIDLFAPLGFGSRALVVAPPKTGKTTLMREAAEAVLANYPDAVVMAVLVGERPEEVTDLRARLEPRGGLVYAASFDEDTQRHAWLVQVAVERAKRLAESGRDAFMVLDSLTRLARAENLSSRGQGRTLSGGIDAQALDTGRRAFGAARNLDEGGSLTILATCLVDTGSRQDDVVYEEFKGTGNMELHLSRELAQRRLFPAVDAVKSSTRREEMLLTPEELRASTALRRRLADLPPAQATQQLLSVMERTPSNAALLQAIEQSGWTGSTR